MFYRLRSDLKIVAWVVGLVAWECPIATIVAVFEIDQRTLTDWLRRDGMYREAFHHQHIRKVNLEQVQMDDLRLKMQQQVL